MARSSAPARSLPIVTVALILANLGAYGLELGAGHETFCQAHGLVPATFVRSGGLAPIFSSMFLHANLTHLVGNLVFLAIFGTVVESALGHVAFVSLYFVAGIAGAFLHVAVDPSASNAMVGCSGCLFGLLAVAGVLRPRLLGFVIAFVAINVWTAFAGGEGDVSFGAHLGGFCAGFLVVALMRAAGSEALEAT
jgi:membrane associated rhomboid family serine protease